MKTRNKLARQKLRIYLLVFVCTFLATTITLVFSGDWSRYYKLNRSHAVTAGFVNGRIAKFSVNNKSYETSISFGAILSRISVEVKYYPTNPSIACACNPADELQKESWVVLLIGLMLSVFVLWGYHHFRKDYWD